MSHGAPGSTSWPPCLNIGEEGVYKSRGYSDGGFSGGNIERPALQELLSDIDRGLIDVVVVYKIDRLTRALADFAKLVERFDARNVSFVSVTQAFSTTTSMGRLTLNVLLSFAQFERELTAERIRDKFAASRAKGIFMGGNVPLGYDVQDRKLIVNEPDAELVRRIFERYLKLDSIAKLRRELSDKGIKTKARISGTGRKMGGHEWSVGGLGHLLRNRVYIGLAVHKGEAHKGQHKAIIPQSLFEEVQSRLEGNRVVHKRKVTIGSRTLLNGLIFDEFGFAMSPKTSRRGAGKSYAYYVSQAALQNAEIPGKPVRPVAAPLVEGLVVRILERLLAAFDVESATGGEEANTNLALPKRIRRFVSRVEIADTQTRVSFALPSLREDTDLETSAILETAKAITNADETFNLDGSNLVLTIDQPLPRKGGRKAMEGWDQTDWKVPKRRIDPNLVKALVRAHVWRDMIEAGEVKTISELADKVGTDRSHLHYTLRLAFLAPDIQKAILSGRQPRSLTFSGLLKAGIPASWAEQRDVLGLA